LLKSADVILNFLIQNQGRGYANYHNASHVITVVVHQQFENDFKLWRFVFAVSGMQCCSFSRLVEFQM